jgi:formylglycine-generating enzyme required for sulfatase activity
MVIPLTSFQQVMDAPPKDGIYDKISAPNTKSYNDICACSNVKTDDSLEYNIIKKKLPRKLRKELKDMVYINEGNAKISLMDWLTPTENDTALLFFYHCKRTHNEPFLLNSKEVTNKDYKDFVGWVKDSIARTLLAEKNPKYYKDDKSKILNREVPIDWNDATLKDNMYIEEKEKFYRTTQINPKKLIYTYTEGDKIIKILIYPDTLKWEKEFKYAFNEPMTNMYFWHPAYNNYPVVGVTYNQALAYCHWKTEQLKKEFPNIGEGEKNNLEYRLPMENEWEYAALGNDEYYNLNNRYNYPWESDNMTDEHGKYYANYGLEYNTNDMIIKSFVDDGALHTSPVAYYPPNDFGLYDMAGNVSEWTEDKPHSISLKDYFSCYPFNDTLFAGMNTSITNKDNIHTLLKRISEIQKMKKIYEADIDTVFEYGRKRLVCNTEYLLHDYNVISKVYNPRIVKGGSWADPSTYLMSGMNQVYAEDSSSCKIGFRVAMTLPKELLPYFYTDKYVKSQLKKYYTYKKKKIKEIKRSRNKREKIINI